MAKSDIKLAPQSSGDVGDRTSSRVYDRLKRALDQRGESINRYRLANAGFRSALSSIHNAGKGGRQEVITQDAVDKIAAATGISARYLVGLSDAAEASLTLLVTTSQAAAVARSVYEASDGAPPELFEATLLAILNWHLADPDKREPNADKAREYFAAFRALKK